MIIQVKNLPSGGYNCDVGVIELKPITYKQILEYNDKSAETNLFRIKRDMDLLKVDLKDKFEKIPFYDFDMLVLMKKSISLVNSDELSIKLKYLCNTCNKFNSISVKIDELNYTKFEEIVNKIEAIKLNNTKYRIKFPTLGDAERVLNMLLKFESSINEKIFTLLCVMDFDSNPQLIRSAIESATRDDIALLEYIYDIYNGCNKNIKTKCSNCNSEVDISVNNMMTDFFRLLKFNIKLDPSKIILS